MIRRALREVYRAVRFGPALYRSGRRIGLSRRHMLGVVLFPWANPSPRYVVVRRDACPPPPPVVGPSGDFPFGDRPR